MQKTEFYSSTSLQPEGSDSGKMELMYYLVSGRYGGDETPPYRAYGVEVRLMRGAAMVDRDLVADITTHQEEAQTLLGLLCQHTVTPVTLRDIIEDRLGV